MAGRAAVILGLLVGSAGGAARGGESYYVLIFGSQSTPKVLRKTHTWATFVRAVGEGPDPGGYAIRAHTISWLPRTLDVRVWRPWPEPGVNLDLRQTLDFVRSQGQGVTLWGPFFIDADLYGRSLEVLRIIESGAPRYRAISSGTDLLIADCIHAVAAVDPAFGRGHYPLIRVGKPASRHIARQLVIRGPARGIEQGRYDNSWLIPRLGLDRDPIEVVPPRQMSRIGCPCGRCPG